MKKIKIWQKWGKKKKGQGGCLNVLHGTQVGRRGCPREGGVGLGQRTLLGSVRRCPMMPCPARSLVTTCAVVPLTSSNPPSIFPVMISVRSSTGGQDHHDHHDTIHEISLPREIRGNGQLPTHFQALWRIVICLNNIQSEFGFISSPSFHPPPQSRTMVFFQNRLSLLV